MSCHRCPCQCHRHPRPRRLRRRHPNRRLRLRRPRHQTHPNAQFASTIARTPFRPPHAKPDRTCFASFVRRRVLFLLFSFLCSRDNCKVVVPVIVDFLCVLINLYDLCLSAISTRAHYRHPRLDRTTRVECKVPRLQCACRSRHSHSVRAGNGGW